MSVFLRYLITTDNTDSNEEQNSFPMCRRSILRLLILFVPSINGYLRLPCIESRFEGKHSEHKRVRA